MEQVGIRRSPVQTTSIKTGDLGGERDPGVLGSLEEEEGEEHAVEDGGARHHPPHHRVRPREQPVRYLHNQNRIFAVRSVTRKIKSCGNLLHTLFDYVSSAHQAAQTV